MIRIQQLKMPIQFDEQQMRNKIASELRINTKDFTYSYRRRSLDARKKPELFWVFTLDVSLNRALEDQILKKTRNSNLSKTPDETYILPIPGEQVLKYRPIIIGSGPAGLFCTHLLSLQGFRPIVIERGEDVDHRSKTVQEFWEGVRPLNPESNVQFGEGGAGTFSDGKLNTLVKDKFNRNLFVLKTLVSYGAKEEILYDAKPHLGTDELKRIVKTMREDLLSRGCDFLFGCRMVSLQIEDNKITGVNIENNTGCEIELEGKTYPVGEFSLNTQVCVLAIGHSARDTFKMLNSSLVPMEQKNFAVGFRIQHPQSMINKSQYGKEQVKGLKAADYKLTHQASNGRSVYSFCMCPGGYVVNASSEDHRVAVNGMSYSGRDSENANSALIVSVTGSDFGSDDPMAGVIFQRKLEEEAYRIGCGSVPVQLLKDYEDNRLTEQLGEVSVLVKGQTHFANLRSLLPEDMNEAMVEAIHRFDRQIHGFAREDAVLAGIESRTSSPIRILRDEDCQSQLKGLYPCGEGAGYAGGITSAAMDGLKVAEAVIKRYNSSDSF